MSLVKPFSDEMPLKERYADNKYFSCRRLFILNNIYFHTLFVLVGVSLSI